MLMSHAKNKIKKGGRREGKGRVGRREGRREEYIL
jgi:hypothetical protein